MCIRDRYIGPILSFPITEDLDLNIIPRLATLSTSITQDDEEVFEESSTGFDLVAALQYDLSWRWSLTLYSSYSQSQVEDNLKVSSVNVNIGIAYRLK